MTILSNLAGNESPMVDSEIINWCNEKLTESDKPTRIKSFKHSSISNAKVIVDLLDALQPGLINYSQVCDGSTPEVKYPVNFLACLLGSNCNPHQRNPLVPLHT